MLSIGFMSEKVVEIFSTILKVEWLEGILVRLGTIIYSILMFFSYFLIGLGSLKFFSSSEIKAQFMQSNEEYIEKERPECRWSLGDFVLGLVFIFFAFSMFGVTLISVGADADATIGVYKYRGMVGRIEQLKEDANEKIKDSAFQIEFEQKLGDVQAFVDDFRKNEMVPLNNGELLSRHKVFIGIYLLMSVACMAAAFSLFIHLKRAREVSFIALGTITVYCLSMVYQFLEVAFVFNEWLSVLNPAFALFGVEQAGLSVWRLIMQPHLIIGVLILGLFIYLCVFYLTRPKVKQRFIN